MPNAPGWGPFAIAAVSAGLIQYLVGLYRDWRGKQSKVTSKIDASILSVGKARDQLERDNTLLRDDRSQVARQHALDRAEWERRETEYLRRETEMRAEIDRLEDKLRALLDEVSALKVRHEDKGL